MAKSLEMQLAAFSAKAKANLRYVTTEALQDVMEAAQTTQLGMSRGATSFEVGKVPVDTADLVNSLVSSNGSNSEPGAAGYMLAIAGMQLGDTLHFDWTMDYAPHVEYGFEITKKDGTTVSVPGRFFVGANAARWQEFVDKRAAELDK